ncbi:MAG: phosphoglucosamine mutase [Candidatus Undinarchaeales archaeon]
MTKDIKFGTAGIRGIANREITPEIALKLGKTFGTFVGKEKTVLIGRDTRTSSEMIKNAVVSGLLSAGCNVEDAGIIPIPLVNFNVKDKYAGGIMVTSSHNPPEWNGIKFILETGIEISGKDEERFEKIFKSGNFDQPDWKNLGSYKKTDAVSNYIESALRHIDTGKIKEAGIKVAADLADGAQTELFPKLLEKIGIKFEIINKKQDGKFSRPPEPTDKTLKDLKELVKNDYDLGIAFDCDGDRMVSVTGKGKVIPGDILGTLIADYLLKKAGPELIVTPIATSSIIDDIIEKHNADIKRTQVGSKYVAKILSERNGLFGFEESDGFVFPEFNLTKDGGFAALKLLDILAETGKSLDKLIDELPDYHQVKKKVKCPDNKKEKVIKKVKSKLKRKYSTMDGLKIFFKNGWILIRPSGTEPILRVYAESRSKQRAKELNEIGIKKVRKALK